MDTTAETLKPAVRATRDRLRAHFTSTALKATRTRKRGAADSVRPRKTSQVSARGDYPFGRMRGGAKGPELQCHVAHDDVQGVRAQIFFSFFSRPRRGEFPRRSRRGSTVRIHTVQLYLSADQNTCTCSTAVPLSPLDLSSVTSVRTAVLQYHGTCTHMCRPTSM